MHKAKEIPQWISSDRHVAQNAIELKEYEWKNESRTLEGEIQLIGSFPLTMRLRIRYRRTIPVKMLNVTGQNAP